MKKDFSIKFPITKEDKAALLAKVSCPTYNEARRVLKPIYEVLVAELYEAGCNFSAKQFLRLIQKEICLKSWFIINTQVKDVPDLLYSLFDNCKTAEIAINQQKHDGLLFAFNLMHESILLLKAYGPDFLWLLNEAFQIVIELIERLTAVKNTFLHETKCHLYFSYGKHIMDDNIYLSMHYLDQALILASGNFWRCQDEENNYVLMRQHICEQMAQGLLHQGHKIMKKDIPNAIQLANKVIYSIAHAGIKGNELKLSKLYVMLVEFLMENEEYLEAKRQLCFTVKYIQERKDEESLEVNLKYNYLKARVQMNLGNFDEAYRSFHLAEDVLCKLDNKSIHAHILMNLGCLQGKTNLLYHKALGTLRQAYTTFNELKDREHAVLTIYRRAIINASILFPLIVDCIKEFPKRKLHWYNFINWRNYCRPFWIDLQRQSFLNEKCNCAFFLLNEYQNKP